MRVLLALLLLPSLAYGAVSNTATTARDAVSLVSQSNAAPDGTITLGLHFQLAPGWHIYWANPGDAGLPPQIVLTAPASAGPLQFPPPALLVQGGITDYVLSGDVVLPFAARHVGQDINASANWLVCSDICVPEHANFMLALNGGDSAQAGLFGPPIPPSPFAARITPNGVLSVTGPGAAQVAAAHFFPAETGEISNAAAQVLAFTPGGMTLALTPAPGFNPHTPLAGVLELTDRTGAMQALTVTAAPGPAVAGTRLITWLGLAFLGGLILNLMPCVFPILAIKALAIARLGGQVHGRIRREAFGYTAGVMVAFLAAGLLLMGLRAGGAAIGWGFQLQSPVFVAAMALLMLAIALNLAGIFKISGFGNFGNLLATQSSFFTGLLAVVVATPCTAPFMGGAIAAALAAPLPAALGIFLALGAGLAAPFLLLALVPGIAVLLPRPGAWMLWLQRALSVPMFATFLWLVWVFISQLTQTVALARLPNGQPFSQAALVQARATGQPVFVDITAAWCITCLVNEHSSLDTATVQAAFTTAHVQTLVGDWTRRNPDITAYLQANGRDGVPLYVYYPAHGSAVILPQILTPEIVTEAIK